MNYTSETLDRSTGELVSESLGDWITVTELGARHGVGPRKVRSVLHHLGLLRREGSRYRLAPFAVIRGLGRRHDNPKRSRYPFDVISPEGQRLVADAWNQAITELVREVSENPERAAAAEALTSFQQHRSVAQSTQQATYWLRDHFPDLLYRDIAAILGVTEQLVGRYADQQRKRREYLRRKRDKPLEDSPWSPFYDATDPAIAPRSCNRAQLEETP
jgi:hypothetical protein